MLKSETTPITDITNSNISNISILIISNTEKKEKYVRGLIFAFTFHGTVKTRRVFSFKLFEKYK